jgi:hypothetical protein
LKLYPSAFPPEKAVVTVTWCAKTKLAVTLVSVSIETLQVDAVPQVARLQPVKTEFTSAAAVSVTTAAATGVDSRAGGATVYDISIRAA